MIRKPILEKLNSYVANGENPMALATIQFIEAHPDCFERTLLKGHITGSAWIVDEDYTHTLLIHHVKLNKWLQPGGHCDGDSDVLSVAMKEANEETGSITQPVNENIFDVDIHEIPDRQNIPAHLHYDIRFLLKADRHANLIFNKQETTGLQWIKLEHVPEYSNEQSILRMVEKTLSLRNKQATAS
jgi:8-oxo-dGTP pyrophosphatase MutT (NUDIX family)